MPTFGSGIMPPWGNVAAELESVTRRGFIPKVVMQIYLSTPLLQRMLDRANSATGGVSPITVPVQGNSMTAMEWSGYSGSFSQPGGLTGLQNAEFNLKMGVVPIPFLGMEGVVQLDHAVIPIIEARMNDAMNVLRQGLTNAIVYNSTNPQSIIGLPAAVDDGTTMDSYGGISRAANSWWKSLTQNAQGADPTRDLVAQYITALVKKTGEQPTMGITGFGTWHKLLMSLVSYEQIQIMPAAANDHLNIAFRSVNIAGVPIYPDPYMPEGTLYLLNERYISPYIHVNGAFRFSGFQSTIPNYQIGYLGILLMLMELVCTKPQTCAKITNLSHTNM